MKELLNKIGIRFKVIISFLLNYIAYLSLIFSFLVYIYTANKGYRIAGRKDAILAIMFAFIIICITKLLSKKYIQFVLTSFITLSYSIKATFFVKELIRLDYYSLRYGALRKDLKSFIDSDMKSALISILIIEILCIILNRINYPAYNKPKNMNGYYGRYCNSDDYYINEHSFNQKKFYSQGSHKYVGSDNMGRGIYKDDVTGKYVTVENNSNDIVDESYSPPYYTPDYNDDYYHNSYDSYYDNNDSYVEHNYGFDNYDNYADYYSDSLNSYMNDDY